MVCTRADDMRFDCSAICVAAGPAFGLGRRTQGSGDGSPGGGRLAYRDDRTLFPGQKTLRVLLTIHSPSREPTTGTTWAHIEYARYTTIWPTGHSGPAISDP